MKIFDAYTIKKIDEATVARQQIKSDELMERAGTQVFNWLHSRLQGANVPIKVFCGVGNNGGDGLVVARHLVEHGYHVTVYLVNYSEKRSKDFLLNLDRIKDRKIWPQSINTESDIPEITSEDIIIDAVFGIGLNRAPAKWLVSLFKAINHSGAFVLSVDIPSGMFMNTVPENPDAVVKATYTLTFEAAKLPFFLPDTGKYAPQFEVVAIGWDAEIKLQADSKMYLVEKQEILPMYIPRDRFSHKGTYGHTLIIAGSYGKIGAATLAAKSALKAGSGLVTAYIPKCGYTTLQTSVPEAMVITDNDNNIITEIKYNITPSAIAIGMGIGTEKTTKKALENFLKQAKAPLVIDADALNIIAANKTMLKLLPEHTILTPHPGELKRLIGTWKDDFDKLKKTKAFSKKYNCIVNIKDAYSIVVYNDTLYVNSTGNPGMATGGSGDVLSGIIAALISQEYTPLQATIFANYLHGKAGDIAVNSTSYQALTAQDIILHIGSAFIDLFTPENNSAARNNGQEQN